MGSIPPLVDGYRFTIVLLISVEQIKKPDAYIVFRFFFQAEQNGSDEQGEHEESGNSHQSEVSIV